MRTGAGQRRAGRPYTHDNGAHGSLDHRVVKGSRQVLFMLLSVDTQVDIVCRLEDVLARLVRALSAGVYN